MDRMQSIAPTERRRLAPLFTDHRHLRPDVDAVLQGYCGTAMANTGSVLTTFSFKGELGWRKIAVSVYDGVRFQ
jgi:hypothetical protein